ncbi:MAG TPA: hypothetical protein VGM56_24270 [Byssovorax sp.]
MSPFRSPPPLELGPLDVGLEAAARDAALRIPRGGRLVVDARPRGPAHVAGAIGSAGVLLVFGVGALAWALGWSPRDAFDAAACVAGVVLGGASLAAVLRVVDRRAPVPTQRGELVGRAAGRALRSVARLARAARTSPRSFGPRRVAALRLALAAVSSPDVARWLPVDLRGRAELLLARALAARFAWHTSANARREIEVLLGRATSHLDDARPAEADLVIVGRAARIEVVTIEPAVGEDDADAGSLVDAPRAHARA